MAAFENIAVPAAFCAGVLEAAMLAGGLSLLAWLWKLQSSAGGYIGGAADTADRRPLI